nr:MAG TPA: hypothetical protein [Caudoviricetes sp.]
MAVCVRTSRPCCISHQKVSTQVDNLRLSRYN